MPMKRYFEHNSARMEQASLRVKDGFELSLQYYCICCSVFSLLIDTILMSDVVVSVSYSE